MFCPSCGKENPAENQFCIECGAELIDNQGGGKSTDEMLSDAANKTKDLAHKAAGGLKRHKKWLIPVAAVIVLVCAFIIIGGRVCDPQRVAEKYFNSMIHGDADEAYSCMRIEESQFTDKASFNAYWQDTYAPQDIYNYTVREVTPGMTTEEQRLEREYAFDYYLNGESSPYTMYVTVVNSGTKRLLFFDDYQVIPDFMVRDYTICTIHGVNVTFDGVPLEPDEDMGDSAYDYYYIPMLFRRAYDIVLENDMIATKTLTVYPDYNGEEYDCFELEYNDTVCEYLYDLAASQVSDILDAAIAHDGFPASVAAFDSVYEAYANLEDRLYDPEEGTGYTFIILTGVTDKSDAYQTYEPYGTYVCSIDFDYSYSYNSMSWWTHSIETDTGERSGRATMEYSYQGDAGWLLTDMYIRY